jgi:hypothetical protein
MRIASLHYNNRADIVMASLKTDLSTTLMATGRRYGEFDKQRYLKNCPC